MLDEEFTDAVIKGDYDKVTKLISQFREFCENRDCADCPLLDNAECALTKSPPAFWKVPDKLYKFNVPLNVIASVLTIAEYCYHRNCTTCKLKDKDTNRCMLNFVPIVWKRSLFDIINGGSGMGDSDENAN